MILNRLYELAEATGLLSDPSLIRASVAFAIKVGRKGEYRGLADYRQRVEIPAKGKAPPRMEFRGGLELAIPVRPVMWDLKAARWKTNDAAASGNERPVLLWLDMLPPLLR